MTHILSRIIFSSLFIAFTLLPWSLFAQNEGKPSEQGLLWKISGNGLESPCFLYGTMHVSNKVAFHLSDSFFIALRSVDRVALEQNPANWMSDIFNSPTMKKSFRMYGRSGNLYGRYSSKNWYERAFEVAYPETKEIGSVLSYQPSMVNQLLYRLSGFRDDFEENTYLDLFIFQSAQKMGKPVLSLEDFEETIRLSMKATSAQYKEMAEKKNMGLGGRDKLGDKNPSDMLQDAYRRGNLAMIDSLTRIMNPSEGYREYFLYVRNRNMVGQMDSIMKKHTLFAGVGAAHLPGEDGMINLLRQKGYTVRAVSPEISGNSQKQKAKLEKTFFPVESELQTTQDGFLSLASPVYMQPLPEQNRWTEMMGAEMVNGAYYMIGRYKTYSPLFGKSIKQLHSQVDTLLFEFIPGEILKQKEITVSGFPGFDITNKTVRGDVQRYKIIITPLEIIVFKLSATGNYFKGKRGDQAIATAALNMPTDMSWKKVKPHTGGFEVEMPGLQLYTDTPPKFELNNIEPELQGIDLKTGDYYLVKRSTLHDYTYIEEDTFDLAMLTKGFAEQLNFEKEEEEFSSEEGFPIHTSSWKNENGEMLYLQTRIQGPFYYLLAARAKERPGRFFNSFKLAPYRYDKEFEIDTDSTVLFTSAVMEAAPENDLLSSPNFRSLFSYMKDDDEDPLVGFDEQTTLHTPVGEEVNVTVNKYHDYISFDSLSGLWDTWSEAAMNDSTMQIISRKDFEDEYPIMDIVLNDSNTIRTIHIRYLLKEGLIYTISYLSDSLSGTPPYAKAVLNTFQPLDTAIGRDLFEDKAALFVEEYYSGDSARQAIALTAASYISLEDKHFEDGKRLIASLAGDPDQQLARTGLLWSFGQMDDPRVLPYLEDLYYKVKDTVSMQVPILNAIASHKTKESTELFKKLLRHNLPLTGYDEVERILEPFHDSLELAVKLFPQLLEYASYDEYKEPVLSLLSSIAMESMATPQMYGTYKSTLLRDAKYELKRQLTRELSMKKDAKPHYSYDDESYESVVNYKLLKYAKLLYPFRGDSEVAAWMSELKTTKLDEFNYSLLTLWVELNLPQSDTLYTYFSELERKRISLYNFLEDRDSLELIPVEKYNQENVVWSLLYARKDIEDKDSVTFIERRLISHGHRKGYVYFYKRKDDDERWVLDYSGLQPADTTKFLTYHSEYSRGKSLTRKTIEEIMDEVEEQIKYQDRKRMGVGRSSYNYDSYLDY